MKFHYIALLTLALNTPVMAEDLNLFVKNNSNFLITLKKADGTTLEVPPQESITSSFANNSTVMNYVNNKFACSWKVKNQKWKMIGMEFVIFDNENVSSEVVREPVFKNRFHCAGVYAWGE